MKIALDQADDAIFEAKLANAGGHSPMQQVKDDIDRCIANFSRTIRELKGKRAEVSGVQKALDLIENSVYPDGENKGKKKYVKETVGKYKKPGDFTISTDALIKLKKVLKLATKALYGWQESIKKVTDTYGKLKEAALKVDADEAGKCLPDNFKDETSFAAIYNAFDEALNGKVDSAGNKLDRTVAANRGLEDWTEAAFNHFQCMEMDQNIRQLEEFGLNAPIQGIKGVSSGEDSSTSATFLTQQECSGYMDHRGRCVEMVSCSIPAGGKSFITFDELIDMATIQEGCEEVTENVSMIGRVNGRQFKVGDKDVPAEVLVAKVTMMTSQAQEECSIKLKFPLIKDGCFVYQDANKKSWGDLTATELKTAKAANFKLAYEEKEVDMDQISDRDIFEVILVPGTASDLSEEDSSSSL